MTIEESSAIGDDSSASATLNPEVSYTSGPMRFLLGERITEVREKLVGLKAIEIGRRIHPDDDDAAKGIANAFSKLETASDQNPTWRKINQIARWLGVHVTVITDDPGTPFPPELVAKFQPSLLQKSKDESENTAVGFPSPTEVAHDSSRLSVPHAGSSAGDAQEIIRAINQLAARVVSASAALSNALESASERVADAYRPTTGRRPKRSKPG